LPIHHLWGASIAGAIVDALDPDRHVAHVREMHGLAPDATPAPDQVAKAEKALIRAAVAPLATNPALRSQILDMKQRFEQTIDTVSKDEVLEAG
jgi:type I restriction enzyme R subunit